MFPFFLFLNRSFSFLRHCCVFVFRFRFPTVFRQFSPTLFPLSVIPFFLTSLLPHCLSFVHCISSILSDFVHFSLSFFLFLVLDVSFVFLNRSFYFLRRCYVFDFRGRFPIVFRQFSPTSFAFSVVLCLSRARCFLCFLLSFFSFLTSLLCVFSLGFPFYFVKSL